MSVLILLIPLFFGAALGAVLGRVRTPRQDGPLLRSRRYLFGMRLAALLLGVVAAAAIGRWGGNLGIDLPGRPGVTRPSQSALSLAAMPFAFVTTALAFLGAAEMCAPRETTSRRTARLDQRSMADLVSRRAVGLATLPAVVLVTLVLVGWKTSISSSVGGGAGQVGYATETEEATYGPWPGYYYAIVLLGGLAIAIAATALVLRAIARRAQLGSDEASFEADSRSRRASGATALALFRCGAWAAVAGVALVMSRARNFDAAPTWLVVLGWAATALLLVALAGVVLSLVRYFRALNEEVV